MKRSEIISIAALCVALLSFVCGFTYTFRTDTPGASDDPREGDDRMREIKAALQERENVDHYWTASSSSTYDAADCGKHRWITFREPNTVTTVNADEAVLFTKDVSSKAELHFTDEDENEIQLTSGGHVKLSSTSLLATLANNTYLTAVDNAGTGTVDLIKATSSDTVQLPDATAMATTAAPTDDAHLANKKYVDDQNDGQDDEFGQYDGSTVFNTTLTASATFQTLDLSSYVGAQRALCFFEAQDATGGMWYHIRSPDAGSSTYALWPTTHPSCSTCYFDAAARLSYLTAMTNSSGYVYHAGTYNNHTVTLKLIAYIPLK